jgi:polysaccharide biosynthesis/export protein VpsN
VPTALASGGVTVKIRGEGLGSTRLNAGAGWDNQPADVKAILPAVLAALSLACAPLGRAPALPSPVELTTLGAGDVFELHIMGEEKQPLQFTVSPDGSCDLPLVGRVSCVGLEPQELSSLVRKRLIEEQILLKPIVSVNVKEYNSKRIEVLGEVQKPGSIPLQPGMTLLRAISVSGGLTSLAAKGKVTIRRRVKGATRAVTVSVQDIIDNAVPDLPLQAGDSIYVAQRIS